jgi:hypothetical protein
MHDNNGTMAPYEGKVNSDGVFRLLNRLNPVHITHEEYYVCMLPTQKLTVYILYLELID